MNRQNELREIWEKEESIAHIHGWDFSHIAGRYESEKDLPWDYRETILQYLRPDMRILDYDTGGGEFLLSLNHPYPLTAATEGYPPNVALCKEQLLPLGIDFRPCADAARVPFPDGQFDLIINRHGSFDVQEIWRLLKKGGIWISEQVGARNDHDLVEMVLPNTESPYPHIYLEKQQKAFADQGFTILKADEAFRPITFYDVGAFVWFARIIEWEFANFSVEKCFDRLLKLQEIIDAGGKIEGTTHRFLLVVQK